MRSKMTCGSLFAVCAGIGASGGCGRDHGWLVDDGVSLVLTPSVVLLAPTVGGAVGPSGTLATQQSITVYGKIGNMPAEGTHIDVCLSKGPCVPPDSGVDGGPLDGLQSAYAQLVANPTGDSNALCRQVSSAQVHCVLGTDGTAQFFALSTSQSTYLHGIPLFASSGASWAGASIYIGNPLPSGGIVDLPPSLTLPAKSAPTACGGTAAACRDPSLARGEAILVQVVTGGPDGGEADAEGGTSSGTPSAGGLYDVFVDVRPTTEEGDAGPPGNAWLTTDSSCSLDLVHPTSVLLTTDPASGSASIYVCADGTAGEFTVSAIASDAMGTASTARTHVIVPREVARFTASQMPCGTDAGTGDVVLLAQDCTGAPVQFGGGTWSVHGQSGGANPFATDPDGRACLETTASGAAEGGSGIPDAADEHSSAIEAGGPPVGAQSLDISVCTGTLAVGGT
jgi:hypothetical protein